MEDITDRQSHKTYSKITLVGELARYFSGDQISAFDVEDALASTNVPFNEILAVVNKANDFIYDVLVPHLFHAFFEVEKFQNSVEEEVELIRGYNDQSNRLPTFTFTFKAQEHLIARRDYPEFDGKRSKSFHLDTYCFDSNPEVDFFQRVLGDDRTTNIYFTGMLVHGQSGFQVYYIHPESHTVCNYHPDFLVYRDDGKAHIIEVKSNWKKDDPVVLAKKEAAERLAEGNQFEYALVTPEQFDGFLGKDGWDAYVPDAQLPT